MNHTAVVIFLALCALVLIVDLAVYVYRRRPLISTKTFAIVALVGVVLALAGCKYQVTKYGPTLTENATVADLAYVPSGHGSGVGISMKGDLSVSSVNIPERYAVVFQCSHGKFVLEGSQYKDLWHRLSKDQAVTIHYREVLDCTQEGGEVLPGTCRVKDLDFLNAVPRGVER
jgi:hypothetical protein